MCGRFTLFSEFDDIIEQFNIDQFLPEAEYDPSYNVAPSQNIFTIINDGSSNMPDKLRWELVPPLERLHFEIKIEQNEVFSCEWF